jgi:hypothetical protein
MFHQCIPLEKKQVGLPINGVTNLESDIVKNTINGKDTLNSMQLSSPLQVRTFRYDHKNFSTYEMEDKATNQDIIIYHANRSNQQAYLMLWEN